jgi:hypothetical protein
MGERVTISYRGAAYELGRGKRCYGIWAAGAARSEPVERWPETPEGWVAAWTRFTAIETPGTIAPAGQYQVPSQSGAAPSQSGAVAVAAGDTIAFGQDASGQQAFAQQAPASGRTILGAAGPVFAAGLLGVGVVFGLVGLFLHYQVGVSLVSQPANLIPHVAYLAVWTLAALLIALRAGVLARAGALLAVGTSLVTFGFFLADLGVGFSAANAGLWLSVVGWLACTAGAALAFLMTTTRASLGKPEPRGWVRAGLLIAAGFGVALAFFPNWDSYLLHASTTGQSEVIGSGFAFSNTLPGWVQAGDVAVMVLLVLAVIAAALWRPLAAGAMLLAGAAIPMGAQAVSGIVAATEPTAPASFGYSASEAQQLGLTITNGLTPAFWVFCLFVVTLLVSCAWMLISPPYRPEAGSAPVLPVEPATEIVTDEAEERAAETVSVPADDTTWTERELAADSGDDRA